MNENTLKTDSEWGIIDGVPCRIVNFEPIAKIENGKIITLGVGVPYAVVILECKKLSQNVKGLITHKIDFKHLWAAFIERGVNENEEVIVFWSRKHLKSYTKLFTMFMPKLWVMICPEGAFKLMTDQSFRPELSGEARWNVQKPIAEWKTEFGTFPKVPG